MSIAVSSSLPDPNALAELVVNAYGLGPGVPCSLISPGVNDTYQVGDSYFYRVYRAGWRSRPDIA
ncbi:MAG TPA: hypothetical protein VNT01_04310 [Symbiobacteriaceae bacterium]|nr:hypothetical protein [Symbiobacteriaceae bacterium]